MASEEGHKDELLSLIRKSKKKGQEIAKKSGELMQFGQHITDLAAASEDVLNHITPSGIDLESKLRAWGYVNEQEDTILGNLTNISMQTVLTSGSTANYAMTEFANPSNVVRFVSLDRQEEAKISAEKLSSIIDKDSQKDKVLSLFQLYDLTKAPSGRKSPTELFETAFAAYEKPVTEKVPATTSLIPMRECINSIITELLRRRHKQERAKSQQDKVLSICHQFVAYGVPEWEIQSLAQRWESLVDKLSSAKQSDYSRDMWWDYLRQATLFLIELLQSLDQSKLKK